MPLERDRYGRPLVVDPQGKKVPYTRCTTFVSALEDTYNLEKWKMRQVAIGMAARPDLVMKVAAAKGEKTTVGEAAETALEVAGSSAAADIGTALHKFTEDDDRGQLDLDVVPHLYQADIRAYREVMRRAKLTVTQIERFGVHDGLKIGGTWDREVKRGKTTHIFDLKTGDEPLKYGSLKIAMQLAAYAHSRAYNVDTGERTDLDVDLERGIVCHLQAGKGKATLHWVDLAAGWEAVQVARQVREWRARRNLSEAFEHETVAPLADTRDPLVQAIVTAQTGRELRQLWVEHRLVWAPAHTELSKARLTELNEETHSV